VEVQQLKFKKEVLIVSGKEREGGREGERERERQRERERGGRLSGNGNYVRHMNLFQ
jgi:hypothetical protein